MSETIHRQPWAVVELSTEAHVLPVDDLIDHDLHEDCPCGPSSELQPNSTWVIIHHSLDGREAHE